MRIRVWYVPYAYGMKYAYGTQQQLPINFNKCEFLRVTNKFSPITITYYMDTKSIKQVSSAKYLGITISGKLQWSELVSRSQTAFFRFSLWWRKKGLVWFTVSTRLDTFEVSIEHVIIALGL